MSCEYDPGYVTRPYTELCRNYPDKTVYPASKFRTEWGPIFHRGRLDGTARVLVIGQDPAQNENIVRRILVGVAGQRFQGFLNKLGIERSYVMINTFLYSMYGNAGASMRNAPEIAAYRNLWIDAIIENNDIEAVVTLGSLAGDAWKGWAAAKGGRAPAVAYAAIMHPTYPESSSGDDPDRLAGATKKLLGNWNTALKALHPGIAKPDVEKELVLYGAGFTDGELSPVPDYDLPAGIPGWMGTEDRWAAREGATAREKRATIRVKVPDGIIS